MGLVAKASGGGEDFEPIPAGMHTAICIGVYDLGTQAKNFKGEPKDVHEVMLSWELPDVTYEKEQDGEKVELPRCTSNSYTLSLSDKANLKKMLESWRGKPFTEQELNGFELKNLVGKPCTLNMVQAKKGDKTYSNIATVCPVMKMKDPKDPKKQIPVAVPDPVHKPAYYSIEDHGKNIPAECPEWIQKKIQKCKEWPTIGDFSIPEKEIPVGDMPADDIPF